MYRKNIADTVIIKIPLAFTMFDPGIEKGETFATLKKVIETLAAWKGHTNYFEASKPVCMLSIAFHYFQIIFPY